MEQDTAQSRLHTSWSGTHFSDLHQKQTRFVQLLSLQTEFVYCHAPQQNERFSHGAQQMELESRMVSLKRSRAFRTSSVLRRLQATRYTKSHVSHVPGNSAGASKRLWPTSDYEETIRICLCDSGNKVSCRTKHHEQYRCRQYHEDYGSQVGKGLAAPSEQSSRLTALLSEGVASLTSA